MKIQKLVTALAAVVLTVSLSAGAWAKPDKGGWKDNKGKSNHGKVVSRTARDKSDDDGYKNHGQKVSSVAHKKGKHTSKRRYRKTKHYNKKTRKYETWREYSDNNKTWRRG